MKDMFELTRRHLSSIDILHLLDMVVFNVLACNTDAHAKNYSIIIRGNGASLAPIYDVLCGEIWDSVTKNLAQKIAGESRGDYLKGRHWQRFARECALNPRQVLDRVGTLAKSVMVEADAAASEVAAMPAGTHVMLDQTRQAVERRANVLIAQLQELEGEPHVEAVHEEGAGSAAEDAELHSLGDAL
jgi:serine/threonine-protein kinase HipA